MWSDGHGGGSGGSPPFGPPPLGGLEYRTEGLQELACLGTLITRAFSVRNMSHRLRQNCVIITLSELIMRESVINTNFGIKTLACAFT